MPTIPISSSAPTRILPGTSGKSTVIANNGSAVVWVSQASDTILDIGTPILPGGSITVLDDHVLWAATKAATLQPLLVTVGSGYINPVKAFATALIAESNLLVPAGSLVLPIADTSNWDYLQVNLRTLSAVDGIAVLFSWYADALGAFPLSAANKEVLALPGLDYDGYVENTGPYVKMDIESTGNVDMQCLITVTPRRVKVAQGATAQLMWILRQNSFPVGTTTSPCAGSEGAGRVMADWPASMVGGSIALEYSQFPGTWNRFWTTGILPATSGRINEEVAFPACPIRAVITNPSGGIVDGRLAISRTEAGC